MELIKILVQEEDNHIRLDRLLRRNYPDMSQGLIEKSLRKNLIRVNGKKALANTRLASNDEVQLAQFIADNIVVMPKRSPIPVVNADIEKIKKAIIYQDSDIIVINKPSGLAVQGGSKITKSVDAILEYLKFGYDERPKLVHRIDKDTSGILLIARRTAIAAKLSACFRNKTIEKYYWALVKGKPLKEEGKISNLIHKQERSTPDSDQDSKEAITYYKIMDYVHEQVAWLEMMPITGRTHQLRIHAMQLGCPIVGDRKYGMDTYIEGAANKLHLHARKMIIRNFNGRDLEFTAPVPAHMKDSFKFFGIS